MALVSLLTSVGHNPTLRDAPAHAPAPANLVVAVCAQRDAQGLSPRTTRTPKLALGKPSGLSPAHLGASTQSTTMSSALDSGNGSLLTSVGHNPTLRDAPAHAPAPANLIVAVCTQRDAQDLSPRTTGTPKLALGKPLGLSPAHLGASTLNNPILSPAHRIVRSVSTLAPFPSALSCNTAVRLDRRR